MSGMNPKSTSLVLLVVFIWGVNFSFIKYGLEELPPILFSAVRFLIVAIPAVFLIPFPKTSIWNVLGVGLFLGVFKFGLLFIAMKEDASAGLASLILQAQVLFTIAFSVLIFKERVSIAQGVGVLVAGIGFSFFFFSASGNITMIGLSLIVLAALFWSISNLIMKRVQGVNLLHFMVWSCLVPPLPLFTLSFLIETKEPIRVLLSTTFPTWLSLVFVSYISTLLAFSIWGWLLRNFAAASVTPFALLIPVVGIATSSILLNERLTSTEMTGAALIILGLVLCTLGNRIFQTWRRATLSESK